LKVEEVWSEFEGVVKNRIDKLYGPDGPAWATKPAEGERLVLDLRGRLLVRAVGGRVERAAGLAPAVRTAGTSPAARDTRPQPSG
jgi:hypothetical protein